MADQALEATAGLLRSLLVRPPHRELWLRHARRSSPGGGLNQAAIAKVIALYLWESGQRPDTVMSLPRELKDRVHRALAGEVLSAETLVWFVEAFSMDDAEAEQLRTVRFDGRPRSVQPISESLRSHQRLPRPQRHRTISVFEHRVIGRAGQPLLHHTARVIAARDGRVESLPHWIVPGTSNVVIERGGRLTSRSAPGHPSLLEITLNSPIEPGQVASLKYTIEFGALSRPCLEYRRVAHGRTENLDIVVEFHPERQPSELWWVIWDDYQSGDIVRSEPVALDPDRCVHRFLPYLENAAVGFRWRW